MRNANPHNSRGMGLKFEMPRVFATNISLGSIPCEPDPNGDDYNTPADVVPIGKVRVAIQPETPFDKGQRVRNYGGSSRLNPYCSETRPFHHADWAAGWASGC